MASGTAWGQDTSRVAMRVGETRQLGVWGGHRSDCVTSIAPSAIDIAPTPRLGTVVQRPGVPYMAGNSISGTCLGQHFLGTAVEYTARAAGTEVVGLDVRFQNGSAHRDYRITIAP